MTARVSLLTGLSGAASTAHLLAECRGAALWLGPSRRAVAAAQSALADAGQNVPALTLQQFADDIVRQGEAAARPLPDSQRRLLIEDVLATLESRGELAEYAALLGLRTFPDLACGFVTELQQHGILPDQFAAAADGAREQQCAALYSSYWATTRRLHLYDEEARVLRAAEILGKKLPPSFAGLRAVFIDRFAVMTPPQRALMTALTKHVEWIWLTLPGEVDEARGELFRLPRQTRQHLQSLPVSLACRSVPAPGELPAGLLHVRQQLFQPRKVVTRSADAAGLLCLETPGVVGEARMAARTIRGLLDGGTDPANILVAVRELPPYADLLREVFEEYAIPVDIEGAEPLYRNPAVAAWLRALRLPDDDWPFAAVTALLRSTYFQPAWPEAVADLDVAQHGEALLRLLGEPRGRAAYLKAVRTWAVQVQPGLEDEQALESRRQHIHQLAVRCAGFLERFFGAWDQMPTRARLADWHAWLWQLAEDLGLRRTAGARERDARAFERLELELDHWAQLHKRLHRGSALVDRTTFFRQLGSLAASAGLARTPRGPGRVRILSAELAAGLDADYLLLLGLGERSFPRLTAPTFLLDEPQRLRLCEAGLEMACGDDRLADEMLLFFRLATAARRQLILSYPALDGKGQELLPSSFLSAVRDCFTQDAIPTQRRRMLIEGYATEPPLSAAEWRVQVCCSYTGAFPRGLPLMPEMLDNLDAAYQLARQRFHHDDFSPFDGRLRDPAVVADLQKRFGPESILSPTALESYIACPFKFFLRHALGLQILEEPAEEIESTDRGLAFHRALSRLHNQLHAAGIHQPDETVEANLLGQLDRAFAEQGSRGSPAAEVLWNIEGQRLKRFGRHYRVHWQKFLAAWLERGIEPRPHFFEVGFGLPVENGETQRDPLTIRHDGVEVRISGRIDRVDMAELPDGGIGFWVIDYKTGRAANYTGGDLSTFRKLQLTLYALAAERVLLEGKPARPLGMAYWLVTDGGAKVALPQGRKPLAWFDESGAWHQVRTVLERWVVAVVASLRQGDFPLKPRSEQCTSTCDYGPICRISQSRAIVERKAWQLPLPTIG